MSLIRQMWLIIVCTVVFAFAGGYAVTLASARHYVEAQLRIKNNDNAQSLALAMSQHRGDLGMIELLVAAQFDTGFYERIRYSGTDGQVIERQAGPVDIAAPAWFVALLPIQSVPGLAQVSDGWRPLGTVEVVSHASFAYADLWRAGVRAGLWLALVGLAAGLVGHAFVRSIRRPLRSAVDQAQALVNRQFVTVSEPRVPELQRLTRAMNSMVQRLQQLFAEQADQLDRLRRQANCDPATGVAHRRHFLTRVQLDLEGEDGVSQGVLLMVRLLDLAGLNQMLGRREADQLIQGLAEALQAFAGRSATGLVGRLNGPDFAVYLPGAGDARAQASDLMDMLRPRLVASAPQAGVVVGGASFAHGVSLSQLLAATDTALARAEAQGRFAVEVVASGEGVGDALGQEAWKRRIEAALAAGRLQLQPYAVVDRAGMLVHQECPLRLQLDEGGSFETATHWLPLALRTRTMAAVDLAGIRLALSLIAGDGVPRGVNVSPASLLDPGFLPEARALLQASPGAARNLWIEVPEAAAVAHPGLVREMCQAVQSYGTRFGLEHAGEHLSRIERLYEIGLDFIKLDARFIRGCAADAAMTSFIGSVVSMAHALGIAVHAEGVDQPQDLQPLWACGVDAVTGPAVTH